MAVGRLAVPKSYTKDDISIDGATRETGLPRYLASRRAETPVGRSAGLLLVITLATTSPHCHDGLLKLAIIFFQWPTHSLRCQRQRKRRVPESFDWMLVLAFRDTFSNNLTGCKVVSYWVRSGRSQQTIPTSPPLHHRPGSPPKRRSVSWCRIDSQCSGRS